MLSLVQFSALAVKGLEKGIHQFLPQTSYQELSSNLCLPQASHTATSALSIYLTSESQKLRKNSETLYLHQ
jgi:hypothetical protein